MNQFKFFTSTIVLAFLFFSFTSAAWASEPSFCTPSAFKKLEVTQQSSNLPKRARIFKVGAVTLAGMAIGSSDVNAVAAVATQHSSATPHTGYCTWYFGGGNDLAGKTFNHRPLPTPLWFLGSDHHFAHEFEEDMGSAFVEDPVSFVSCAETDRYIGVGCNAQKHRGPSVFAMLLAFAGCTPEHATQIANSIWDKNGVRESTRVAIARKASAQAAKYPSASARFRSLLEN